MRFLSWLFETSVRTVAIITGVVMVTRGDPGVGEYFFGGFLLLIGLFVDFEASYVEDSDD